MIEIEQVTKYFDGYLAVNHISLEMKEGMVYGLIGTNGAGKSTLLRMICGVLNPDEGRVFVDGEEVYDNPLAKEHIFFIADEPHFFSHGTAADMKDYYKMVYPNFDEEKFAHLLSQFHLEMNRRIGTFSKGMKKQLAFLLAICSGTKYILCDETFDGLDPVMRQAVKSLIAKEMQDREFTPIIASHNLRELEDICDTVGLLHQGGVLLSKDIDDMKGTIQKIQCVPKDELELKKLHDKFEMVKEEKRGSLYTCILRSDKDAVCDFLEEMDTVFAEVLPLTLEEIFICETEVVGYDIKKLVLEVL